MKHTSNSLFGAKDTDISTIRNHLLAGKFITVREAIDRWDIVCLPQIVSELRHHRDIPVKTRMIEVIRSDGRTARYARYFMTPGDIAAFKGAK